MYYFGANIAISSYFCAVQGKKMMNRGIKRTLAVAFALFIVQSAWSQRAFRAVPIPDSVYARMRGVSFPEREAVRAGVRRTELRYLQVLYYDFDGVERQGELVCNRDIADDLLDIFKKLHEAHYPIACVRLIDDYGANDELSMAANNTSCFCFRSVAGSTRLSKHAKGMAIDINPLQNPYVRKKGGKTIVQPTAGAPFANRSRRFDHKIGKQDLAYRLFTEHGFKWGGAWRSVKDYQHFEK